MTRGQESLPVVLSFEHLDLLAVNKCLVCVHGPKLNFVRAFAVRSLALLERLRSEA